MLISNPFRKCFNTENGSKVFFNCKQLLTTSNQLLNLFCQFTLGVFITPTFASLFFSFTVFSSSCRYDVNFLVRLYLHFACIYYLHLQSLSTIPVFNGNAFQVNGKRYDKLKLKGKEENIVRKKYVCIFLLNSLLKAFIGLMKM